MCRPQRRTGAGTLAVVFGEPDLRIEPQADVQVRVRVKGGDVFCPQTDEIEHGRTASIALRMTGTEYNEVLTPHCSHRPRSA